MTTEPEFDVFVRLMGKTVTDMPTSGSPQQVQLYFAAENGRASLHVDVGALGAEGMKLGGFYKISVHLLEREEYVRA